MNHARRAVIAIWSFCTFILVLFVSLIPLVFSRSFFAKQFEKNNTYQEMNLPKEELMKAIDHTLDYMWDKEDSLVIEVTLNDGSTREFYQVWSSDPDDFCDEYAHMADVKVLFMKGKSIALLCGIIWVMSLGALILERKQLTPKMVNVSYITYGVILGLFAIIGIWAAADFDSIFTKFHALFFPQGNWQFPWYSFMIMMLPETLFSSIVYKTLIRFFIIFGLIIGGSILLQKKVLTKNLIQNPTDTQP